MVERTSDRQVVPGTALATLQIEGGPTPLLRDQLRPLLVELAHLHDESVALAIDDGDGVLYLAQIDAGSPIRAPDVHAERHPFHVVAHGLALMSRWDDARIEPYLASDLAAFTRRSVVDPVQLRDRLAQIRKDGFAWTLEEFDDDVNGLAVVVSMGDEHVASVGYFGPAYRLAPDERPELAQSLLSLVARRAPMLLGS
jgi:DNA-binding IclR family transcriptional regulator